jgi:hypothetical protein
MNDYDGLTRDKWRYKQPKYRAWRKRHLEYLRRQGYYRALYQRKKVLFKRRGEEYRAKVRTEAFAHYGTTCYCCGEQNTLFLTLGHINNDGAEHRRILKKTGLKTVGGHSLYLWLKRNAYPPLPLQVECFNCNCAKQRNGGVCPHFPSGRTSVK